MSQQRSGGPQYANSNINTAISRATSASSAQPAPVRYGPGLVSLGAPKRPRASTGVPVGRLSIPRPVNLPSLKKENSGNDPNTQLVPSASAGARGSWKQPEEQQQPPPESRASALTAGSNWAAPGKAPGLQFPPPEGPYPTAPALQARDRHLNPHDYPTLAATLAPRQHFARQPVPSVPQPSGQGGARWDEDERQLPPAAARPPPPEWHKDEPRSTPPWEPSASSRNASQDWRSGLSEADSELFPRPARGPEYESAAPKHESSSGERWAPPGGQPRSFGPGPGQGYPPLPSAPPRGAGYSGGARFAPREFPALPMDPTLFPPPPSRAPPNGHSSLLVGDAAASSAPAPAVAALDPDREAFERELEKVAADIEQERLRKLEDRKLPPPPPPPPQLEASEQLFPIEPQQQQLDAAPAAADPLASALSQGDKSITAEELAAAVGSQELPEDPAAAMEAARARAVALRAQREAAADEADKKRREAAQAKLAELDQRIARRKAEEAAKAAAAEAQEAAEKAALELDVAAASSAPDPTPAADLGITAASLDVNLSGSVARDLEQLADAAAAAAAGEDLAPESPVRPAASVEAVEAAIETLEGEVLLKTEQLAEWEKLPGSLPNGMAEGIVDGGDGLEDETTTQILAQQVPGDADWDSEGASEPPRAPTSLLTVPLPTAHQMQEVPFVAPVAALVAPPPRVASTQPPPRATSWRTIVSGEPDPPTRELSPREAAVAAAQAAQEKLPATVAPPQTENGGPREGGRNRREDRRGRGPKEPREGERPERVRGGRGRERNRERRGGRRREGDATSLSAEDSQGGRVGLPEGEEAPTMGASAAPRPHRGSQRRGPREPVPGEEGQNAARGRGRAPRNISPRGPTPPGAQPPGVPTRIVKPPGLPQGPTGAPPADSPAGDAMQAVAEVLSGVPTGPPPAPTLPPGDPPQPQPTFAWGNLGSAAGQGQLPEADSSRDTSLLPVLDPVAPLAGREGLLPDIPVERPTSAAGFVGRPQRMPRAPGRPSFDPAAGYDSSSQQPPEASSTFSSASADLPNGMPQLPADLTLEGPTLVGVPNAGQQQQQQHDLDVPAQQQQQQSVINFGGLSRIPGTGFPTGAPLFSPHGNLWQNPPPPSLPTSQQQQQHASPTTSHSLDSFLPASGGFSNPSYGSQGGGSAAGGGSPLGNTGGGASLGGSVPQFGGFGSPFGHTVQFGQLQAAHTPFIPTGKQPDWSTGPVHSSNSGPSFSRALDNVVGTPLGFQHANGPQPPGLHRHSGSGPSANGAAHPPAFNLGPNGRPHNAQIPPGLGGPHMGGAGGSGSFQAAAPGMPLDAGVNLPDDVMGSEVHGPRSGSAPGKGMGRGLGGPIGRARGMEAGRRGSRGGRGMDPGRGPGGPPPNPQGGGRGIPLGIPRGGINAFVGARGLGPRPPPPRPPPNLPGLGVPQIPPSSLGPPMGPPPDSARGPQPNLNLNSNAPGPSRRGRGGRSGGRGDSRRSSSGGQLNAASKPVVKDGANAAVAVANPIANGGV